MKDLYEKLAISLQLSKFHIYFFQDFILLHDRYIAVFFFHKFDILKKNNLKKFNIKKFNLKKNLLKKYILLNIILNL